MQNNQPKTQEREGYESAIDQLIDIKKIAIDQTKGEKMEEQKVEVHKKVDHVLLLNMKIHLA